MGEKRVSIMSWRLRTLAAVDTVGASPYILSAHARSPAALTECTASLKHVFPCPCFLPKPWKLELVHHGSLDALTPGASSDTRLGADTSCALFPQRELPRAGVLNSAGLLPAPYGFCLSWPLTFPWLLCFLMSLQKCLRPSSYFEGDFLKSVNETLINFKFLM